MTTIEFFHDAVCGWCYLLSPRLRELVGRYQIKIIHRAYVLQQNNDEMIAKFSSMKNAKKEILEHWKHCQLYDDRPNRFNIEGMRCAEFDYPSGFNAALAAKAAEALGGQVGHWNYFDAVQISHLKGSRKIADIETLLDVAEHLGFIRGQFADVMSRLTTQEALQQDISRARTFGIQSVPSILINGQRVVSQTLSIPQLEALFKELNIKSNFKESTNANF